MKILYNYKLPNIMKKLFVYLLNLVFVKKEVEKDNDFIYELFRENDNLIFLNIFIHQHSGGADKRLFRSY